MEAGVMKLMGDFRASHNVSTPLIGFATYGRVHGRDALKHPAKRHGTSHGTGNENRFSAYLEAAKYPFADDHKVQERYERGGSHWRSPRAGDGDGAYLDPNYSHQILVDSGETGKWGDEIEVRVNGLCIDVLFVTNTE